MRASGPLVHCPGKGAPIRTSVPHTSATILQDATRARVRGRVRHLRGQDDICRVRLCLYHRPNFHRLQCTHLHCNVQLHSKMTTVPPSDHFHLPDEDGETEEQIAYEKDILAQHYHRHADQNGSGEHASARPLSRGFMHSPKDDSSGSGIRTQLKGFVRDLKATSKSAARLVSLESRLTKELDDPSRFPEIARQAVVRKGLSLCPEETAYLAARRARIRDHFAKYMGLDAAQVHPDDIPTVTFGGSGGGYRAMLAFLGYSLAMKEAGMWDLLTYVAGVSGSCE